MGLDIYVGSLTRYYAGEWENVAEKATATDRPEDRKALQLAIQAWRSILSESLGGNISHALEWDEAVEAPYFTGRPGWDGFGSLVLWAAYAEHPTLSRPAVLPEEWDDDPALMMSNVAGFRSRYSHLVRNVELWLPSSFEFTFEGEDIDGTRVVFGSTMTLKRQLEVLNAATWQANAAELGAWKRASPDRSTSLELQARYAFAILSDLVREAVEHNLPMKLDY